MFDYVVGKAGGNKIPSILLAAGNFVFNFYLKMPVAFIFRVVFVFAPVRLGTLCHGFGFHVVSNRGELVSRTGYVLRYSRWNTTIRLLMSAFLI